MGIFSDYNCTLDGLREHRRMAGWTPQQDRPWLARLDNLYERLSVAEQELADELSWRGWPMQYDQRLKDINFFMSERASGVPEEGPK